MNANAADFGGETYEPAHDAVRLHSQMLRVWQLMRDSKWRTLAEIAAATGDPTASVSARLRDFRKEQFGCHVVERRPRGPRSRGLFEYRVLRPDHYEQQRYTQREFQ